MRNICRPSAALILGASAVFGLSACGPDAPTAAAPSTAGGGATSSTTSSPMSTSAASPTTVPSASAPSSPAGAAGVPSTSPAAGGSGQCNEDSAVRWSVKTAGTKLLPFGQAGDANYQGSTGDAGVPLNISVGKPSVVAPGSNDYSVDDGYQLLVFDVKMSKKTPSDEGYSSAFYLDFSLVDDTNHLCRIESSTDAIPKSQMLDLVSLDTTITSASGKIAFEVPKGKDYSKYMVLWGAGQRGQAAPVGWHN